MMRVGVLASGSGSNFQALVDALQGSAAAKISLLICNVPGAKVIDRATRAGIEAVTLDHKRFASREAFDTELVSKLKSAQIDLVCLAGYMRLVSPAFLRAFPHKVINIHPALLPSFPGLHAARQAIDAGVKVSGCTVHFVDDGTDTGPIIAQATVPVLNGDDEAALITRINTEEHRLYPSVVKAIAEGRVTVSGRTVQVVEAK